MNAVHVYDWDDAPDSLRKIMLDLLPAGYRPRWIAYAEHQSKSPTYLLALMTSAWIGMMRDDWHKVFLWELESGGEVRMGCEKKRGKA
jgi:hypothetical protein